MKFPEPNYICEISGRKCRKSEVRKMWDGKIVHKDEYEVRQPQDFTDKVRAPKPLRKIRTQYVPD